MNFEQKPHSLREGGEAHPDKEEGLAPEATLEKRRVATQEILGIDEATFTQLRERIKDSKHALQDISNKMLFDIVGGLGISSVNLSGGFFRKETKEKRDFYLMAGGCAGYLRNQLRHQKIKVNLSRYVAPSRESIGKLDPITKDTRDFK